MRIINGKTTAKKWSQEEHICNTCLTRVLFEPDDEAAINAKLAEHDIDWWQMRALHTLPFDCPVCGEETGFGPVRIWSANEWESRKAATA